MESNDVEDVISTKYGKLKIISRAATLKDGRARYNCLCDCGKQTTTRLKDMKSGKSASCGCGKRGQLRNIKTGKRYGDVVVLGLDETKMGKRWNDDSSQTYWRCQCDCGTLFSVVSQSLKNNNGGTKSCGCSRIGNHNKPSNSDAPLRYIFNGYKSSGNARYKKDGEDFKFSLSYSEAVELFAGNCYYCGIKPDRSAPIIRDTERIKYNGIDRINSSRGYSTDNCVSCCSQCNWSKSDLPQQEFLSWAKRVAFHQQEKENLEPLIE